MSEHGLITTSDFILDITLENYAELWLPVARDVSPATVRRRYGKVKASLALELAKVGDFQIKLSDPLTYWYRRKAFEPAFDKLRRAVIISVVLYHLE